MLLTLLWLPPSPVVAVDESREGRVRELATLLGEMVPRPEEIERIIPAASRFPPNADTTRALSVALAGCRMAGLSEPRRLMLARHLYAITTGRDMLRDQLERILTEIQQTALDARCDPVDIDAIVNSARRVARSDPKPRRDWW